MCSNLVNKQYYIRNKQYSKQEYFEKIKEILPNKFSDLKIKKNEWLQMKEKSFYKYMNITNSENCY
jgi:hypothetical protein